MLFMFFVCHAFASVHFCLVVTCWERADFLALVCTFVPLMFPHRDVCHIVFVLNYGQINTILYFCVASTWVVMRNN